MERIKPISKYCLFGALTFLICVEVSAEQELKAKGANIEGSYVFFQSVKPVQWEDVARKNFNKFNIDTPDIDELNGNYNEIGGASTFYFTAKPPPELTSIHYYLLTPQRIEKLVPNGVRGLVRYRPVYSSRKEWPGYGFKQYKVDLFYGYIRCSLPEASIGADRGIVVQSDHELELKYKDVPLKETKGNAFVQSGKPGELIYIGSNGNRATRQQTHLQFPIILEKLEMAKSFQAGNAKYIFTEWSNQPFATVGCMGGIALDKINPESNSLSVVTIAGTECVGD